PAVREPDPGGGGYGLRIVGAIATAWGYEPLAPYGKRVWADIRE
ncbi:MAG: ATP-binding protein, partial [Actinobacteria bacterium]|nr:ATP-binding protein [Actinomycetota bacterium]